MCLRECVCVCVCVCVCDVCDCDCARAYSCVSVRMFVCDVSMIVPDRVRARVYVRACVRVADV